MGDVVRSYLLRVVGVEEEVKRETGEVGGWFLVS